MSLNRYLLADVGIEEGGRRYRRYDRGAPSVREIGIGSAVLAPTVMTAGWASLYLHSRVA